ncbi:MAG: alpha-ketoglutarate-dependent dioxygenase AlkB [Lentisphaeria bacterium]|nr:alpha-ketoglutarate-dependent dioxygenase AlkB [Lentisphaeria bacterium]
MKHIPMPIPVTDGDVVFDAAFFSASDADRLLAALLSSLLWEQHLVRVYGRTHPAPRLSAWYGDEGVRYTYSGLTLEARPWTPELQNIRSQVEAAAGASFNTVLLNQYRDGKDSMGWHSDDEPELGTNPVIASVSFGDARRFIMRHKTRGDIERVELALGHGSVLIMRGATQHNWQHHVPRTTRSVGTRVNLTFRLVSR